jgi:hypothetical protein
MTKSKSPALKLAPPPKICCQTYNHKHGKLVTVRSQLLHDIGAHRDVVSG